MRKRSDNARRSQAVLAVPAFIAYSSRPMSAIPSEFPNVTAVAKANVYFDGKCVSHTVLMPDGAKNRFPGRAFFESVVDKNKLRNVGGVK